MAPIVLSSAGMSRQVIDDPELEAFLTRLRVIANRGGTPFLNDSSTRDSAAVATSTLVSVDLDALVTELKRYSQWWFEEQADLYEWITPLNLIDSALTQIIHTYPRLLLVEPTPKSLKFPTKITISSDSVAQSIQDVDSVPQTVVQSTCIILQFLISFLRNSMNKAVFNSVAELSTLLAAADDTIADLALQALSALSIPPLLSRQQSPEVNLHTTALHVATPQSGVHARLMELARGWGTKGTDLGLVDCVTADDSIHGQGSLPQYPRCFTYEFYTDSTASSTIPVESPPTQNQPIELVAHSLHDEKDQRLISVQLLDKEILRHHPVSEEDESIAMDDIQDSRQVEKRRRMGSHVDYSCMNQRAARETKTTAELFFIALSKAGGRTNVPSDRVFPLLALLRLTKSFHCQAGRITAVERRLYALIAVLYGHPSQDIMMGYFHAQPELCTEIVDIVKPIIDPSTVPSIQGSSVVPSSTGNHAFLSLADSSNIPHKIRTLAVECLTALVARRESNNGGTLSGLAKLVNVFNELGVGKSQFLGFLPTLVRFALASFNSFLLVPKKDQDCSHTNVESDTGGMILDDGIGFELGRVFLQASKPNVSKPNEKLEQALEFIDVILTLTSAVASVSAGTLSLTECGIIPALLNTISLESAWIDKGPPSSSDYSSYVESSLTFVVAQVVQILEVAVAIHSSALAVFYDAKGVELLVKRISLEVQKICRRDVPGIDVEMNDATTAGENSRTMIRTNLNASKRSLLFSLVNCLTVVFHQQDHMSSSNPSRPPGSRHLQNVTFSESILDIFENVDSYGGVLAALTCTLVSDIVNSDPPVMHFLISSGLADAILFMITGRRGPPTSNFTEPRLPPSSELIMATSSMLSTFSITSDGEEKLLSHNPFREFLGIFLCSTYSMPDSRCLSSDIPSIVGTALEDIIRNHSSFRNVIIHEVVECLKRLVLLGSKLVKDEISANESAEIDRSRTLFIQYSYNLSQIIEQLVSSNDENLKLFEQCGGFEQILSLYPSLIPHGRRFLAHVSTHSAVSLAILTQSQTVTSLTVAFESSSLSSLNEKLISKILCCLEKHLDDLQSDIFSLRLLTNTSRFMTSPELITKLGPYLSLDITGSFENIPLKPIHLLQRSVSDEALIQNLSSFLRSILVVEWLTDCLAVKLKSHKRWVQDSALFTRLQDQFYRLSMLHRSSIYELCRIRTAPTFEERESKRWSKVDNECHPSVYRLRIVCPEGAVVRDGIDIDSSLHVGGLDMGETITAYDRCLNSSGVMRYRTTNGWVSEQTRGHGRELIAEVFAVEGLRHGATHNLGVDQENHTDCRIPDLELIGRIDCGIPDLAIVGCSILARLQSCFASLCSSFARAVQGSNSSSSSNDVSILQLLAETLQTSFRYGSSGCVSTCISMEEDGTSMYMGYFITLLNACLFEERRDRIQTLHVMLLARILLDDGFYWGIMTTDQKDYQQYVLTEKGFIGALRLIFRSSLLQMSLVKETASDPRERRFSRSVAASFPTAVAIVQKLISKCTLTEASSWTSIVKKFTEKQMRDLFVNDGILAAGGRISFDCILFAKGVGKVFGDVLSELLLDVRFANIPSHMLHPLLFLVKSVIGYLEDYSVSSSDIITASSSRPSDDSTRRRLSALSSFFGDTSLSGRNFQPSEDTINRLIEMGFSRELSREAVERSRSNNLEIATEWALSHFPSMPSLSSNANRDVISDIFDTAFREVPNTDTNQLSTIQNRMITLDSSQTRQNQSSPGDVVNKAEEKKDNRPEPNLQDIIKVLKKGVVEAALVSIERRLLYGTSSSLRDFDSVTTTVACSFLLDFCDRYPSNRSEFVVDLMGRFLSVLMFDEKGSSCKVLDGNEAIFASLCHASVLVLRALPSARPLALRFNVVSSLTQCIRSHTSKTRQDESVVERSPLWLPPALLLLEVMSQPVSIELEEDDVCIDLIPATNSVPKRRNDYSRTFNEHKKQRATFAKYSKRLLTFANDKVIISSKKKKRLKLMNNTTSNNEEPSDNINEVFDNDDDSTLPMFLPLITHEAAEACAIICVNLLRGRQRKSSEADASRTPLSSNTTHALLMLLISVIRSNRIASLFFNLGGVELLLSLHNDSRFEGHCSLLTVVFCRILEDENTLQAAMESEIKSTLIKLYKKQENGSQMKPSIPTADFLQSMTSLIHRDHMTFIKSMFVTVKVESVPSADSTSLQQYRVVLLTPEERSANIKFITESSKNNHAPVSVNDCGLSVISHVENFESSLETSSPSVKSKPCVDLKPSSLPQKGQKKDKASINDPMGHMSMVLLNDVIMKGESNTTQFLKQYEVLDIIADLVLSIPGFSNTIHISLPSLRLNESSKANLRNSTLPSSMANSSINIIKYILHLLLPQPEVFETGGVSKHDSFTKQKSVSSSGLRLSQSSARLLISLVARPGESRWFVISELSLAFLNENPGDSVSTQHEFKSFSSDRRMWALKAWGDLCLGVASLRSIGTASDKDNSSFNTEIIGIMYEAGVPYGLFDALKYMNLHHPMAAIVAAALLRPLEIFTRCSVIEAVKEIRVAGMNKISKKPTSQTLSLSQVDAMAFEESDRHLSMVADSSSEGENQDDSEESSDEDDNSSEMESLEDEEMDDDDDDGQEEEEDEEDDSSDAEPSSHNSNNHEESIGDAEVDDDNQDVEDSSSSEAESDHIDINDDFDGNAPGWNDETDDYLDGGDEDDPEEIAGSEGHDGWTRIDNNHSGGILELLASRGGIRTLGRNRDMSMPGGEFLDHAAEAIGSILRDSNLEIEAFERLGLRISRVPGGGRQDASTGGMNDDAARRSSEQEGGNNEKLDRYSRGPVGPYPSVNQRSPPDMGFSSANVLGRLVCPESTEYLFSTSMHGDTARAFYLPGTTCINSEPRNVSSSRQAGQSSFEGSQLFPRGRSQLHLHPLLSGVNLPPSNALVPSIEHGQNVQTSQSDREAGWSGILSSNSQGNLIPIRVNRVQVSQSSSTPSGLTGIRGWLDEATSQGRSTGNSFVTEYDRVLRGIVSSSSNRLSSSNEESATATAGTDIANNEETGPALPNESNLNQTQSTGLIQESLENRVTEMTTDSVDQGLNLSSESSFAIEHDNRETEEISESPDDIVPEVSVNLSGPSTAQISDSLPCPPGIDIEVFRSLPEEMQLEVIASCRSESDRLDSSENVPNPANAEDMDNASFIASLSPDLRDEILRTADDTFLNTLPPAIIAEAQLIRERANSRVATITGGFIAATMNGGLTSFPGIDGPFRILHRSNMDNRSPPLPSENGLGDNEPQSTKAKMVGKMLVSPDPDVGTLSFRLTNDDVLERHGSLLSSTNVIALLRLTYLLSPVRPQRLLQKVFRNICELGDVRRIITTVLFGLLNDDEVGINNALAQLDTITLTPTQAIVTGPILDFPPKKLIGTDPRIEEESNDRLFLFRRRQSGDNITAGAAIATYLPLSTRGASSANALPTVVARRLIGCLQFIVKHIDKFPIDVLNGFNAMIMDGRNSVLDAFFGLLSKKSFFISNTILDEILCVLDIACAPLASLPLKDDIVEDQPMKNQGKKIWVNIPRAMVSPHCLQLLCSILRLESCKDTSLSKIHSILHNLSRVDDNRVIIVKELVSVARHLSIESIRDLKALSIRLDDSLREHSDLSGAQSINNKDNDRVSSSGVTLASSSNELKLLRVLQTLQTLFFDDNQDSSVSKYDGNAIGELNKIFEGISLDSLWEQLGFCLRAVSSLEGVRNSEQSEDIDDEELEDNLSGKKKLRNNVAGLMTRFLPIVEAFFVVHSVSSSGDDNLVRLTRNSDDAKTQQLHENHCSHDLGHKNKRLVDFVSTNRVLLNALLRNHQGLLDKGLKAMVQVPQCRNFIDFDVKRLWFKSQVKRLRQQANRRYGSLRLNIRRQNVFEDAYHQLRLRNADEMRGKLHVSFRHEEGIDAGGLSREFFSILAKEIFNPNYALFTSTEDGCTFQPNMHSSINPDHLSYFRFVGRIVGKAILDGYLLDVHFTRSLYKHMLGFKPTYHDMEAIDPDYYKNLQTILDYNLDDIDLDLTFSTETHSFGRSLTIDLLPNGRNVKVNESNKKEYVDLICQHRMTTAIEKQIKAYLDGFHEMIKSDLISIFNARELELLISGMPDIDVSDLKKNTEYDGCKSSDIEIQWFWNILFSLSRSDKAAFVQFVTGSSKVPLGGFSQLQGMRGIQKFSIHKVLGTKGALMSAHTCFNSLDLPSYESEEEMKEKLLYAIHEGSEGFLFA